MFSFIKDKLNKIYSQFSTKVSTLFKKNNIDQDVLDELEALLISSDMGIKTSKEIVTKLKKNIENGEIKEGDDLKKHLETILINSLSTNNKFESSKVFLLVGINGSGKTTFAGKLANMFAQQNKKVLLAACDTFRAAAAEQLLQWAKKSNVSIQMGKENQGPSAVVFDACQKFKNENFDILIIDTAGRLQAKTYLMQELEKISKIINKQLPQEKINTLLTIDAMLGQNSFEQAKIFNESTKIDGLVLTKMDGTGKAGVVFAIVQELSIPVSFICFGEEIDKIKLFDAKEFVSQLLSE